MTDRSIELFMQAVSETYKLCKERGHNVGEIDSIWVSIMAATLTELTVKECGQILVDKTPVVYLNNDWNKAYDQAMNDSIHHIYKHFGLIK